MTVGQRIQHYRKLQGLSQEELGQKLLVSRQTVSLWENDQTLPAIDNLVRLKEIFGVSIDDLLLNQQPQEQAFFETKPLEKYQFQFSENEFTVIKKAFKVPSVHPLLLCACYLLFGVIYEDYELHRLLTSLAIYACILFGFAAIHRRNVLKKEKPSFLRKTFSYEVHENYIYAKVYEGERLLCMHWIPEAMLPRVVQENDLYAFTYAGQWFAIRGQELDKDSHLLRILRAARKKQKKLFAE